MTGERCTTQSKRGSAPGDFATGLEFVNLIGDAAEAADHHDVGGKTQRDIDIARQISTFAADLGVVADPHAVQRLELGLDTWDRDEIKPFWLSVP